MPHTTDVFVWLLFVSTRFWYPLWFCFLIGSCVALTNQVAAYIYCTKDQTMVRHIYIYIVQVKGLDTPTHSRVFLYWYYFLHYRIIVKTSKRWNYTHGIINTKKSVKQIKIDFIFYILQSSHALPKWQLCTLLAFSQPASPGMLFQQSWSSSHICWALVGCFSFTLQFNSSQNISIGLRSGDCGGQVIWRSTPSLSILVN